MVDTAERVQTAPERHEPPSSWDSFRRRLVIATSIAGMAVTACIGYGIGEYQGRTDATTAERGKHCPPVEQFVDLGPDASITIDNPRTAAKDDEVLTNTNGHLVVNGAAVNGGTESRPLNSDGSVGRIGAATASTHLPVDFRFQREGEIIRVTYQPDPNC